MRSKDSELADYLLSKYNANCEKYGWLRVREKGAKGHSNLVISLQNDKKCYLTVCKATVPIEIKNDPTTYILSPITAGLFIAVLQDISGGRSHTVRSNRGLNFIYDCMETHKLKLNTQKLNKCCGPTQ